MRRVHRLGGVGCLAALLATASGCSSSSSNGTTSDAGTSGDGGASALSFKPSNIDIDGMDLSKVDDIDIAANPCTLSSEMLDSRCFDNNKVAFKTIAQSNNVTIGVYVAKSWHFEAGSVVSVFGKNPVALVALDSIDVAGSFSAASLGDNPIGGGNGSFATDAVGAGPGGGAAGSASTAGGGGSFCGVGGVGGVSSGGTPAAGGAVYGNVQLVPFVAGSQGGGGAESDGGGGGGAIQLVAGTSISVESGGVIKVGGGHGNFTGGAGGSGGAILLEAPNVTVAGRLAANGGGGQGGPTNPSSDGLPSNQPAQGSAAAAGLTAAGGNGSAGATVAGGAGGNGDSQKSVQSGGGGGGAGFIRINTQAGFATLSGTLSPDATTKCMTQGTLH